MSASRTSAPDWDLEQLEVILEPSTSWQFVVAGPGSGKSAVACQRVAYLVDEAIPPSRILLVSFTRTAVAELRNRIVSYSVAGTAARSVRIFTIDSHAWSLRTSFDDEPFPKSLRDSSYDLSIERTVELFKQQNPDLIDFMARFEHVIIDEAQDVIGLRADLVIEMLKTLSASCGVTILADPAQAIYGFTTDACDDKLLQQSLLERLPLDCPRPLLHRSLKNIHRVENETLVKLFSRTRKQVEAAESARTPVARVQDTIRETCGNELGLTSFESLADFLNLAEDRSMLVLFRRKADVLFASSYCSQAGVEHRLRMSALPIVVRPWLGWLLAETVRAILDRENFDNLWEARAAVCAAPFVGEQRDECWDLLHRLAAGKRPHTIDLVHLRDIVSRSRPPIELCYPELGVSGPILGTIHASKGREADTVVLVMPPHQEKLDEAGGGIDSAAIFEEARVYYVGATRARKMLATTSSSSARVGYLDSGRIFRICGDRRAQLEIGRDGDVDRLAHLAWSNVLPTQLTLAQHVGRTVPITARAVAEEGFALRVMLEKQSNDGVTRVLEIGQLSSLVQSDLRRLWSKIDHSNSLRPRESIPHLYLAAVGTVGLSEAERAAAKPPFSQSGFALVPVVKGFPMIHFLSRGKRWFGR